MHWLLQSPPQKYIEWFQHPTEFLFAEKFAVNPKPPQTPNKIV